MATPSNGSVGSTPPSVSSSLPAVGSAVSSTLEHAISQPHKLLSIASSTRQMETLCNPANCVLGMDDVHFPSCSWTLQAYVPKLRTFRPNPRCTQVEFRFEARDGIHEFYHVLSTVAKFQKDFWGAPKNPAMRYIGEVQVNIDNIASDIVLNEGKCNKIFRNHIFPALTLIKAKTIFTGKCQRKNELVEKWYTEWEIDYWIAGTGNGIPAGAGDGIPAVRKIKNDRLYARVNGYHVITMPVPRDTSNAAITLEMSSSWSEVLRLVEKTKDPFVPMLVQGSACLEELMENGFKDDFLQELAEMEGRKKYIRSAQAAPCPCVGCLQDHLEDLADPSHRPDDFPMLDQHTLENRISNEARLEKEKIQRSMEEQTAKIDAEQARRKKEARETLRNPEETHEALQLYNERWENKDTLDWPREMKDREAVEKRKKEIDAEAEQQQSVVMRTRLLRTKMQETIRQIHAEARQKKRKADEGFLNSLKRQKASET